jgi:hypothetical protein
MKSTIDIDKIATYLKTLSVHQHYDWNIPTDEQFIFDENDLTTLKCETNFEANVKLKTMLERKISNNLGISEYQKYIFEWIVCNWGGIKKGRENVFELGKMQYQQSKINH